jgi:hypothetical protein
MARLHPDSEKTRVVFKSGAEAQFYEQCRATLGNGWLVFHSCVLSTLEGDEGLKDNEIDFVCYHPKHGVIVVEVKGGRIRHDGQTGAFYSVNRHGQSFEIKDPFQQALAWKSRFLRFLKRNGVKVPVSHAVSLPGVAEDEFQATSAIVPELIIGRGRLKDLDQALKNIAEKSQPEQYRRFDDCGAELERLLVGSSFTTRLFLKDYIDGHEHRVKDVETIHETLITPIASARRLGIEGEAGTGKTMLAVLLARHFRDQGKSVLLLGSNALLNLLLRRDLGEGIDAQTYPELAAGFGINLLIPPPEFKGEKDDWIQYEAPERLKKATLNAPKRWDVLICDEAQDVQPFWWEAIESVLAAPKSPAGSDQAPADESRFYLFFDSCQGVFGSGEGQSFVAADVLPIKPPYFPLVHNYRTTREIAAFSRAFRQQDVVLQSHSGRLGYVPELVVYKDAEDARRLLTQLTRKLTREEELGHEDVTLLSARNPAAKESVLYQTDELGKIPLHRLTHGQKKSWKEAKAPAGTVAVSTIAGFKGMETNVGILINVSEYNLPAEHPIMASLIYVACTRAKHMLYVFVQQDDPKRAAFEEALAAIKATGTMVLEGGAKADFEFLGRVTHWNPERVGWLTVDDPAFQQGSVMFFPHDVKMADIRELKVGSRLKFRPRAEGGVTIACELIVSA